MYVSVTKCQLWILSFLPSATSALQAAALTGLKSPFAKYLNWGTAELAYMDKIEKSVINILDSITIVFFMLMIER